TFIWKYEKPEDNISDGFGNIVEALWTPQTDLLHDSQLTAFITHGGQGSITESATAGVALVCIPVTGDQFRNCKGVERNGVGMMIEKESLAYDEALEATLRKLITDNRYRQNTRKLAQMIVDRPFPMKDIFVRNMEFLAKYGPLTQISHQGANLTFIEYYLIDVFAFIALGIVLSISLFIFITCKIGIALKHVSIRKAK
ncbi:hypothetical protein PENTCL1PPCAC_4646, partial [Pristionchus entomophagus]